MKVSPKMFRIKEVIKSKNKRVKDIAQIIGIEPPNFSNIINGKSTPSLDMLQRIASALNVHISELFEKDTPNDNIIKCPNCGAELEVKKKEVK